MASKPNSWTWPTIGLDTAELSRRLELARQPQPEDVRRPRWKLLLGELEYLAAPFFRRFQMFDVPQASAQKTVMILPGFAANPLKMRFMARKFEKAGHKVKRWGLGFNWGPQPEKFDKLERRLLDLAERYGRPVHLVGWSLGGLFARELAKRHPEAVAQVITMGSPFSGNLRANNVWRFYHFITGHSVDNPPIDATLHEKPPVRTVAMWSPRDGIISPRSACGGLDERDKAVALRCTHMGFSYSKEAILAVLRELEMD